LPAGSRLGMMEKPVVADRWGRIGFAYMFAARGGGGDPSRPGGNNFAFGSASSDKGENRDGPGGEGGALLAQKNTSRRPIAAQGGTGSGRGRGRTIPLENPGWCLDLGAGGPPRCWTGKKNWVAFCSGGRLPLGGGGEPDGGDGKYGGFHEKTPPFRRPESGDPAIERERHLLLGRAPGCAGGTSGACWALSCFRFHVDFSSDRGVGSGPGRGTLGGARRAPHFTVFPWKKFISGDGQIFYFRAQGF